MATRWWIWWVSACNADGYYAYIQNEYTNIIPEISNNKLYNKENNYSETTSLKNPKNEKIIKRKNINYNLRAVFFIIMIILFFFIENNLFKNLLFIY